WQTICPEGWSHNQESSGEGGIRTPGTVTRTPHFECGPIDHSGTSPDGCKHRVFCLKRETHVCRSIPNVAGSPKADGHLFILIFDIIHSAHGAFARLSAATSLTVHWTDICRRIFRSLFRRLGRGGVP